MLESLVTQVAGLQFCKIRLRRKCFPCSYLKFLTATFLALNKLWKKHSCKKHGSEDIYRKSNYATFCFTLRQDFCISGIENGLYKVLLVKKKKNKQKNQTNKHTPKKETIQLPLGFENRWLVNTVTGISPMIFMTGLIT